MPAAFAPLFTPRSDDLARVFRPEAAPFAALAGGGEAARVALVLRVCLPDAAAAPLRAVPALELAAARRADDLVARGMAGQIRFTAVGPLPGARGGNTNWWTTWWRPVDQAEMPLQGARRAGAGDTRRLMHRI